jgi:hypothetical protein
MFARTKRTTGTSTSWTGAVMLPAVLLIVLGAWVCLVPLAGPYFSFGFDTSAKWRFSQDHLALSLAPGIAIALGGILMTRRSRAAGWLAGLLAVAGGIWLVVGPSLHPLWSSHAFGPLPGSADKTAARWIATFYGAGALAVYLGAQAQGLLERRTVTATAPVTTAAPVTRSPAVEREDAIDHPLASRPTS